MRMVVYHFFLKKVDCLYTHACLPTSRSCVRDVILCSDYLFQSMKRDDKIYVGKILAAGFVPQIPTSTQYCHKLWLTQHCLIDHSNFLIYTPTSYKFQLFYFVWFLFYLGVGSEPHWIGDQVILPNFFLSTAFRG